MRVCLTDGECMRGAQCEEGRGRRRGEPGLPGALSSRLGHQLSLQLAKDMGVHSPPKLLHGLIRTIQIRPEPLWVALPLFRPLQNQVQSEIWRYAEDSGAILPSFPTYLPLWWRVNGEGGQNGTQIR